VVTFADSLRRLTDQTTYLLSGCQALLVLQTRCDAASAGARGAARRRRTRRDQKALKGEARTKGDLARVYACVAHDDIADQDEARLVILDPADPSRLKEHGKPGNQSLCRMPE